MIKISTLILSILSCFPTLSGQDDQSNGFTIANLERRLSEERFGKALFWFKRTDINHDGLVSLEEFPKEFAELWNQVDIDKNGYLTLEEELHFQIREQEEEFILGMSKENRILTIQKNLGKPNENRIQDITGEWLCFTTMSSHGSPANGIMYIKLIQNGVTLKGELQQLKSPGSSQIREIGSHNDWEAAIEGELIPASGETPGHNLLILRRENLHNNFKAVFSGFISANGDSILAQLVNTIGDYGTMLMVRRSLNPE